VRNVPDQTVRALERRAILNGRSAEKEHRLILEAALRSPARRPLAEVLARMPNVGVDADFARNQVEQRI
jgi:plasmid stability protein